MKTEIEIRVDPVSLDIDQKLALISPTQPEQCIFKVHDLLRKENEKAYEPKIVAIGPYHRDKKNLKPMEEHKFRYLQQFLHLSKESSVDKYVMAMRNLEERTRNYYADSFNELDSDKFVKMMLLDGVFILHFFRKHMFAYIRAMDPNDPIIQLVQNRNSICYDLLLYENQLPFFILDQLMNMLKSEHPKDNIVDLAQSCLRFLLPSVPNDLEASPPVPIDNVHHILGLMHEMLCSSFVRVDSTRKQEKQAEEWKFIKCTTKLQEAGVKFKKPRLTMMSPLDIEFDNGVMMIPPLVIDDNTERVFRNLIAYEQFLPDDSIRYFTDYRTFLDCLINSAKDVEILRHKGIIENWLGDDEVVSTMFNKLGNHITVPNTDFCYSDIFNKVNEHCRHRPNTWLANLRRNYFNTPWSIISFIAAVVLLLLTLTQTICSIRSCQLSQVLLKSWLFFNKS